MSATITLPDADGSTTTHRLQGAPRHPRPTAGLRTRRVIAAAHVVADPLSEPDRPAVLDWDTTLALRHELWSWGLGVAEAMDTAQRGMGLGWTEAIELIRRTAKEASAVGGAVVAGATTDQLGEPEVSLSRISDAYLEQCAAIEDCGAQVALMPSPQLRRAATHSEQYAEVYGDLLRQLERPAVLHWLGPDFVPALRGYWGCEDMDEATEVVVGIVEEHKDKVDGIKLSLLDPRREEQLRARLPEGVRMYTGDDFNYADLILGDGAGHSDALLGVLDGIAPVASAALQALDDGDVTRYRDLLDPTVPFARHVFAAPTQYYKAGLVFLAYLNGQQPHFRMVGGLESMRSVPHLSRLIVLADQAGLLLDPELAVRRARAVLAVTGFDA